MRRYRLVIFVHPTLSLAIAGFLARVPLRLGTGWRLYSFLFNVRWWEHRKDNKFHELEYNLHLLTPILGSEPTPPPLKVYLPPDIVEKAKEFNIPSPFVIIHPGGLGSSLRWSAERYRELVKLLIDAGIRIVITGSEEEKDLCDKCDLCGNVGVGFKPTPTKFKTFFTLLGRGTARCPPTVS